MGSGREGACVIKNLAGFCSSKSLEFPRSQWAPRELMLTVTKNGGCRRKTNPVLISVGVRPSAMGPTSRVPETEFESMAYVCAHQSCLQKATPEKALDAKAWMTFLS